MDRRTQRPPVYVFLDTDRMGLRALHGTASAFELTVLTLIAYIVGLMAKPMIVTLPILLFLLDYWPSDEFRNQQTGGLQ